jgi:hypothetical protein
VSFRVFSGKNSDIVFKKQQVASSSITLALSCIPVAPSCVQLRAVALSFSPLKNTKNLIIKSKTPL